MATQKNCKTVSMPKHCAVVETSVSVRRRVFVEKFDRLVNAVKPVVVQVAVKTFSKHLISDDNICDASNRSISAYQRANDLLQVIMSRIKDSDAHFDTFVGILQDVSLTDLAYELKRAVDPTTELPAITASRTRGDSDSGSTSGAESVDATGFQCPCGHCSLEKYFRDRSKCPGQQETTFPFLNTSHLNRVERETLEHQLIADTNRIKREFQKLSDAVFKALERNETPVSKIRSTVFSSAEAGSSKMIQMSHGDRLECITTIYDLKSFLIRYKYISFINYGILEKIIDEHCKACGTDLNRYLQKFEDFSRRNIFEVPSDIFTSSSTLDNLLVVKVIDEMWFGAERDAPDCHFTLRDIKFVQTKVTEVIGHDRGFIDLIDVGKGCLQLAFEVLSCQEAPIFPLSTSQLSELIRCGIIVLYQPNVQLPTKIQTSAIHSLESQPTESKTPLDQPTESGSLAKVPISTSVQLSHRLSSSYNQWGKKRYTTIRNVDAFGYIRHKVFVQNFARLVNAVKPVVVEVAVKAFSEHLISENNKCDAANRSVSEYQRANDLLQVIMSRIESSDAHFDAFVAILQELKITKLACELKKAVDHTIELPVTASTTSDSGYTTGGVVQSESGGFRCPCGHCNLESYFASCPDIIHGAFPYLDVKHLSKYEQDTLRHRFEHDANGIIRKFQGLLDIVFEALDIDERPIDEIKHTIFSSGQSHPKPIQDSHGDVLSAITTVSDVKTFLIGHKYISFINYGILEEIIENHCKWCQAGLDEYLQCFEAFCKRSVFEVPPSVINLPSTIDRALVVIVDDEMWFGGKRGTPDCLYTIKDLTAIQKKIAEVIGLKGGYIHLLDVQDLSVSTQPQPSVTVFMKTFLSRSGPMTPPSYQPVTAAAVKPTVPSSEQSQHQTSFGKEELPLTIGGLERRIADKKSVIKLWKENKAYYQQVQRKAEEEVRRLQNELFQTTNQDARVQLEKKIQENKKIIKMWKEEVQRYKGLICYNETDLQSMEEKLVEEFDQSDFNYRLVSMALTDLVDWHKLGLMLGLKKIKFRLDFDKYGNARQRDEMVKLWLRSDEDASWEKLCTALENMHQYKIADEIRRRYFIRSE